jgi:uncharacterized protein (DUF2164 family)
VRSAIRIISPIKKARTDKESEKHNQKLIKRNRDYLTYEKNNEVQKNNIK